MKPIKMIAVLALGITSLSSTASQFNDHYTLAVIKHTSTFRGLSKEHFANVISHLAKKDKQSADQHYENSMSLCAANIKLSHLATANQACDKAVNIIEQTKLYKHAKTKGKYKALALNNRAIVKHLGNDNNGAYQDFNLALSLNKDPLIITNFNHFSSLMMDRQFGQ